MGMFDFLKKKEKQDHRLNAQKLDKLEEIFPGITDSENPYKYMEDFSSAWMAKQFAERKKQKPNKKMSEYESIQAYVQAYTKVTSIRRDLIKTVDQFRYNYLVDSMISQLIEDAFTPEISTGEILSVRYDNTENKQSQDSKNSPFHKEYQRSKEIDSDKINSEIKALDERINFDRFVNNIAPDMLLYGDYILRPEINPYDSEKHKEEIEPKPKKPFESIIKPTNDQIKINNSRLSNNQLPNAQEEDVNEYVSSKDMYRKDPEESPDEFDYYDTKDEDVIGLVDIYDDVDQSEVVCLSDDGLVVGYLVMDEKGKVVKKEPYEFVKFSVESQRIRIDLLEEINKNVYGQHSSFVVPGKKFKDLPEDVPRFIRIGKSLVYSVVSKIKELELMDALVPATKIEKLTNGAIVGLQLPDNYDINKALDATDRVEGIINKKVGIDKELGELTIENIMSAAGKIKVVPQFGSDKGGLDKINIKSDEPDDLLGSIEDIRRVILSSIGIPYELVFDSDGSNKGEILKRYARYLRKLKNIQKSVQDGIKQIIIIHLVNAGIEFDEDNIVVEFRNKLVEIDILDKLEFIDTTIGMLDSLKSFVESLNEEGSITEGRVDKEAFIKFLNDQLSVIGLGNIIKPNDKLVDENNPTESIKNLQGRMEKINSEIGRIRRRNGIKGNVE